MALIALDVAPIYPDIEFISGSPTTKGLDSTNPRIKNSNEYHSRIMMKVQGIDFKKTEEKNQNAGQAGGSE
jgi:hypothetical protein